jgi:hypothetical protein
MLSPFAPPRRHVKGVGLAEHVPDRRSVELPDQVVPATLLKRTELRWIDSHPREVLCRRSEKVVDDERRLLWA